MYESQKKYISLNQEVAFLKEYFNLEIDRYVSDLNISCDWNIPENNFKVVPFIISTFVENAFKHVLPTRHNDYFIKQTCQVDELGILVFEIDNTFDEAAMANRPKGVGLKHVQERLKLVYADNFRLSIQQENEIFSMQLKLNLR